jgi:hypothetical protein
MNQNRRVAQIDGRLNAPVVAGVAAPAPAAVQFEAAKSAAAQRSATNLSMADAADALRNDGSVRRAGNVTFALRDGVWTDVRYKGSGTVIRVKPFSDAYFKAIELQPELREAFSVGDRVIVAGRNISIELSPNGVEQLSDRDQSMLRDRW